MVLSLHVSSAALTFKDHNTILINAVLLFVILFYTFPLKFLFTLLLSMFGGVPTSETIREEQWPALMTIYGVGLCLVYWLFGLLYYHAYQCREHLKLDERELYLTRYSVLVFLLNGSVGLLSVATVWITREPGLAGLVYFTMMPLNIIAPIIQRRALSRIPAVRRGGEWHLASRSLFCFSDHLERRNLDISGGDEFSLFRIANKKLPRPKDGDCFIIGRGGEMIIVVAVAHFHAPIGDFSFQHGIVFQV